MKTKITTTNAARKAGQIYSTLADAAFRHNGRTWIPQEAWDQLPESERERVTEIASPRFSSPNGDGCYWILDASAEGEEDLIAEIDRERQK